MFDNKELTNEQIEEAKQRTQFTAKPYHEHPDCIRIAAEWLDAQRRLKAPALGGGRSR